MFFFALNTHINALSGNRARVIFVKHHRMSILECKLVNDTRWHFFPALVPVLSKIFLTAPLKQFQCIYLFYSITWNKNFFYTLYFVTGWKQVIDQIEAQVEELSVELTICAIFLCLVGGIMWWRFRISCWWPKLKYRKLDDRLCGSQETSSGAKEEEENH